MHGVAHGGEGLVVERLAGGFDELTDLLRLDVRDGPHQKPGALVEAAEVVGAISDIQAERVRELVEAAGQPFDYQSFPAMGHSMHGQDPALFAKTLTDWALKLP